MSLEKPHGPSHESSEFWYSTEHEALLYGVTVDESAFEATAIHSRQERLEHREGTNGDSLSVHRNLHGIEFSDAALTEEQQRTSIDNVEMIVRLWNQVVDECLASHHSQIEATVLPIPKLLAMFLEGRRTEMYKDESVTQALVLLQIYISSTVPQSDVAPSDEGRREQC